MSRPILPDAYIEVLDGALGLMSEFPAGVFAQVGRASKGPVASPITLSDAQKAMEVFGSGDLAIALTLALMSGARMVLGVRAPTSIPGFIGQVWTEWRLHRSCHKTGDRQRLGGRDGYTAPVRTARDANRYGW